MKGWKGENKGTHWQVLVVQSDALQLQIVEIKRKEGRAWRD